MNIRKRWTSAPVGAGLAAALLSSCSLQSEGGAAEPGKSIVVGMSDDVLAADPASGYDPGSWLLFNNVFQSLLSFPRGSSTPSRKRRSPASSRTATGPTGARSVTV